MNRILNITLLFTLLAVAVSCTDSGSQARSQLKKIVKELNSRCPLESDCFVCVGAQIEDDNVVASYIVDENVMNLDLLKNKPDMVKKFGGSALFTESPELADLIISSGYGLILKYKGSQSKKLVPIHFTNQDVKDIKNAPQDNEDILNWQIESSNAVLPQQVDEITVLTSITRDGQDVAYNYELDDEAMDMAFFNDHLDEMKANLSDELEALNSPMSSFKPFMKLLCRTNKNLLYVYKGKHSGQTVTITFTNSELRDIIQDYIED